MDLDNGSSSRTTMNDDHDSHMDRLLLGSKGKSSTTKYDHLLAEVESSDSSAMALVLRFPV